MRFPNLLNPFARSKPAAQTKSSRAGPMIAYSNVGALSLLEDQMCRFTADGKTEKSPDRVDALVWALTELSETSRGEPKIRVI